MSEWTHKNGVDGIKKQAQELIEQAYQRGYKAGQEKALVVYSNKCIEQGRSEAWEAAGKIIDFWFRVAHCDPNKLAQLLDIDAHLGDCVFEKFFEQFSATEAIEKIREYEERNKQKDAEEIHIGDEVKNKYGFKYFVTGIKDNLCWGIGGTGYYQDDIKFIKKTGHNLPGLAEVLKKMQEGE